MKNIALIIVASLLLMTSCGGKGKTSSSFSLSLGAITNGTPQNGGVIITGHRLDDSPGVHLGFAPGEELSVELENGVWEFAAVSWVGVGGEMFTGDHNCGYVAPINLQGGEVNINFSLAPGNCDNIISDGERFSNIGHFGTVNPEQFRVLKIRSCLESPGALSGTSCTLAGEKGLTKSYKLVYGDNEGVVKYLSSSCYNILDQDNDIDVHNIKIPIGDSDGNIFSYKVLAFTEDNCGGEVVSYHFQDGIYSGLSGENNSAVADSLLHGEITYLFLEHNPLTQSVEANPLFGFGDLGDITINTDLDLTATNYARIQGINPSDTRLITVDDATIFSPHDELMWLVNEQGLAGSGCSDFVPGLYEAVRIKSIVDTVTIELYRPINHYKLFDGTIDVLNIPTGTTLTDSTGGSTFCSMQFIKFSNYENLTVDGGGATSYIKPMAYNKTNGVGGVLAIKVKNTLRTEGSNVIISADQKGRESADVFSYAPCPFGKKCAYFGNSGGGGIIFVNAAHLEVDAGNTIITSTGASTGAGAGGQGGSILFMGNNIDINAAKSLHFVANGGNGTTLGGDGGNVSYNYCDNVSINNGTFNVTDVNGGVGSPNGSNGIDDNDTSFCPL